MATQNSFIKLDKMIMKNLIEKCGANGLMVYSVLLSHRNTTTNKCFPSIESIMEQCKTSKSTIQRSIKKLYDEGFIIIDSGRQGIANSYFFPLEEFYNGEGVGATRIKKGNFEGKEKR